MNVKGVAFDEKVRQMNLTKFLVRALFKFALLWLLWPALLASAVTDGLVWIWDSDEVDEYLYEALSLKRRRVVKAVSIFGVWTILFCVPTDLTNGGK
jgi:hypothetical protein